MDVGIRRKAAYEEGQQAFHRGASLDDNPKRRMAPHWARGWLDAQRAEQAFIDRATPVTDAQRAAALAQLAKIRAMLA